MTPAVCRPLLVLTCLMAGTRTAYAGCEAEYRSRTVIPVEAVLATSRNRPPHVSRLWGRENMSLIPSGADGVVLQVRYPAGSINPGNSDGVQGGGGFELRFSSRLEAACLKYRVRFEPGFAFARGGKLPGLFGGQAPRGCAAADLSRGVSARLMWRAAGAGELYLYSPDRTARCGDSIGRDAWRFTPGEWVTVEQQVVLNTPGQRDGTIRIWIDGRPVVQQ